MRNTGEASVITGIIVLGIIVTPIVIIYNAVDDAEEGLKKGGGGTNFIVSSPDVSHH